MQELTRDEQLIKNYVQVVDGLRKKYPGIEGVKVDISESEGEILLSIGEHKFYMTPEQAVDLMKEIRRAVVKVKPKALHRK